MDSKQRSSLLGFWTPLLAGLFFGVIALVLFMSSGEKFMDGDLLAHVDSYYNTIYVYQTSDGLRHMVFGHAHTGYIESVDDPADPMDLRLPYTRLMTVGVLYDPAPRNILSIGMGGGKVSSYLLTTLPGPHVTEVELDPEVVRLARKYFDYKDTPRRTVVVEDGRKFLMDDHGQYDMILLDAYRGSFVPFHLLTKEFYAEVKSHLAPGGVVVQNVDSSTLLFDSTIATLQQSFDQTECFHGKNNVVAVAYDGPRLTGEELASRAQQLEDQYHFRYPLPAMLQGRTFPEIKPGVKPLTDDFAPVDTLKAIAAHNRKQP